MEVLVDGDGIMCNKLINKTLLWLGFTMYNKSGNVFVKMRYGKQIKSNKRRVKDYSMDDDGWKVLGWML